MTELVAVARLFRVRPSELIHGLSSWEAYCFDVAAAIYVSELDDGNKPIQDMGDATAWLT